MSGIGGRVARYGGQAALYALFAAFVGYFSDSPAYVLHGPSDALIKFSVSHPGKRKEECRQRSREELAKLPPNMRSLQACSRERHSVRFVLTIDGRTVFDQVVLPSGLSRDGPSSVYRTFVVPAGARTLGARMNDAGDNEGWTQVGEASIEIRPAQALVIGFRAEDGRFFFR